MVATSVPKPQYPRLSATFLAVKARNSLLLTLLALVRYHTSTMKLLVGLGNPGKEYERTRHNAGFLVVDEVVKKHAGSFKSMDKCFADVARIRIGDTDVIVAKPTTFMNLSGKAVQAIMAYYKIALPDVLIVHDEKDLPLGSFRIHHNRGAAGHNGVDSIFESLATRAFDRLRVGVGPTEPKPFTIVDYVLAPFGGEERKAFDAYLPTLVSEIETWVKKKKS